MRDPFPKGSLEWWSWLSRGEWQTLYCVSLALEMANRTTSGTLGALFRETLGILQCQYGMTFDGVHFSDGEVIPKQEAPLDERNQNWETQLRWSTTPDYLTHFPVAARTVQQRVPDSSGKQELLDLIQGAWQKVTEDAAKRSHQLSPEERAMIREWVKEFLEWKRARVN